MSLDAKSLDAKSLDAKQCPWCLRYCLKDSNCNYIFACGLDLNNVFHVGQGCGRAWCYECGKKFCGRLYDEQGRKIGTRTEHDRCCFLEPGFSQSEYCPGGHNSHCKKRF